MKDKLAVMVKQKNLATENEHKTTQEQVNISVGSLSLPSHSTMELDPPAPSCISGIERIEVELYVSLMRERRDSAIQSAETLHNTAEKLKRENRELKVVMLQKIELERDFWRNKILEGQSRAGRMVKAALMKIYFLVHVPVYQTISNFFYSLPAAGIYIAI